MPIRRPFRHRYRPKSVVGLVELAVEVPQKDEAFAGVRSRIDPLLQYPPLAHQCVALVTIEGSVQTSVEAAGLQVQGQQLDGFPRPPDRLHDQPGGPTLGLKPDGFEVGQAPVCQPQRCESRPIDGESGALHGPFLPWLAAAVAKIPVRLPRDLDVINGGVEHPRHRCCVLDLLQGDDVGLQARGVMAQALVVCFRPGPAAVAAVRGQVLQVPAREPQGKSLGLAGARREDEQDK